MEASSWDPSLHCRATRSWWLGNSLTALESLQIGKWTWNEKKSKWKDYLYFITVKYLQFPSWRSQPCRFSPSTLPALKKFAQGFLFLVVYAVFSPHYPDSYYLTDEFEVRILSKIIRIIMFLIVFLITSRCVIMSFSTGSALLVSLYIYSALG